MPIVRGHDKDKQKYFYKYGKSGKKYFYTANDKTSRTRAKRNAEIQGRAINISQNDAEKKT
jgi:hypothetical protein